MSSSSRSLVRAAGALVAAVIATLVFAAPSMAIAPRWSVEIHHEPSNLPPGGVAQFRILATNVGDMDTFAFFPMQLHVQLPPELTYREAFTTRGAPWSCSADGSGHSVDCSVSTAVTQKWLAPQLYLRVDVDPTASGVVTTTATVNSFFAPEPGTDEEKALINGADAAFGTVPGSFAADFYESDRKRRVRQAGAHPYEANFAFDFNSVKYTSTKSQWGYIPNGTVRNLTVDLPPGFVGDPTAVGECTPSQLNAGECPRGSQVGRIDLSLFPVELSEAQPITQLAVPVYNMEQPKGVINDLGFSLAGNPTHIRATLDPTDYSVQTTVSHINESLPVLDQRLTIWGVPADPSHDRDRCSVSSLGIEHIDEEVAAPCTTDHPRKAFLTVPSQCADANHQTTFRNVDSWQHTGVFEPELRYPEPGFQPTGCERQRFEPTVDIHPVNQAANTPTGLDVNIEVPQNTNPDGLMTAHVEKTVVTFPQGMTVSPSFADGLSACSLDQIGLGTNDPVRCPDSSRIGTVDLRTPILPKPLTGSLYLAEQGNNPFGTLMAMYVVLQDTENRGILVKVPGRLDLNEQNGQIVNTFEDLPQFPFSNLELHFRSGPRAPLINPPTCGVKRIGVELTSYADPANPVDVSDSYDITQGANGTGCQSGGERPFRPKMTGGTVVPNAGAYSPFLFRMTRTDADQELSQIDTTLPAGLTAKLKGIGSCPESAISSISTALGSGRAEQAAPKCPASSFIGNVYVGVGAGPQPNYFPGKAYLAGPYKGAPLSLVVSIASLAGPYDLGNVTVRTALHVDPTTAQVRAVSDPFPLITHGVLLRVTDVRLLFDRPETMLNPTNCSPMSLQGLISGTGYDVFTNADDTTASVSDRFQVANCASLDFKPKLAFRLKGGTHRGDYPALTATLTARPGDANIARTAVTLPHSEFLAQEHIRTICTRVQFAQNACPPASVYGHAQAISPLLDDPLEGPVYLRSSSNPLPDMVAKLDGRFNVVLSGRIDSKNQGIRNTFDVVPDAPVTKFTLQMQGGKKSLLVNSKNLCKSVNRADVRMTGQNGKTYNSKPVVSSSCKKKKHKKAKKR
jgi:hypothetical protein